MSKTQKKHSLEMRQLDVVLTAQYHNPSLLNAEFLRNEGIVPRAWKAQSWTRTPDTAQVKYSNGASISVDFEKIVFTESLHDRSKGRYSMPRIAHKYAAKLPYVNYSAVGINPYVHVRVESLAVAQRYIRDSFFKSGPWTRLHDGRFNATPTFFYNIQSRVLQIKIAPANLSIEGGENIPVLLFIGNYHRKIAKQRLPVKRIGLVGEALSSAKQDIRSFFVMIKEAFWFPGGCP